MIHYHACLFYHCSPTTLVFNAIAPLPSPENPDSPISTSILLSSLTVDDDSPDEAMVALIGIEGAVGGEGHIRITTPRKDGSIIFPCTEKGSFVATLMALPGDLIAVSFMDSEERESLPIEFHVHSYEKPVTKDSGGTVPPEDGKANQASDTPSALKHAENSSNELALVLNYANGQAHFTGAAGFIGTMDILMIANESDGNIYYTSADSTGAVDFSISAQPGDLIVLFAINPLNNTMTTPASQFEIPGTSKPTVDKASDAERNN